MYPLTLFYFVILLFSSYLALLLIIYFSTPYDINYHLETSAHRVVESLTLLLGFFSLYNLNILNTGWHLKYSLYLKYFKILKKMEGGGPGRAPKN